MEEGGLSYEQIREIHLTACDVAFTDESTRAAVRARLEATPADVT